MMKTTMIQIVCLLCVLSQVDAFSFLREEVCSFHVNPRVWELQERPSVVVRRQRPGLQLASDSNGDEDELDFFESNNNNNETLVTREMFQRDLLQDPVVVKRNNNNKGKNGKSRYMILDNRDSLPFRVEHVTPDPYTHPELKKKKIKKVPRRPGSIEDGLISSVYDIGRTAGKGDDDDNDDVRTNDDGKSMVGEFLLDKHTTTGDLLEIGEVQYRVSGSG